MSRGQLNYSKAVIYKLCCKDQSVTDFYIGSTTNLTKRTSTHKTSTNNEKDRYYNRLVYTCIRENGGWDNWDCILVEDNLGVENRQQLLRKEGEYVEKLKPTLNKQFPGRTPVEYREDNREKINIRSKKYREDNKEEIALRRKKYYEENKEKIALRERKRYEANKEKIKEKIICECGEEITRRCYNQHCESRKHIDWLNSTTGEEKKVDKILCGCGVECARMSYRRHLKSKRHIEWLNPTTCEVKNADKISCECGGRCGRKRYTRHCKTKMHMDWVKTQTK